MSRKNIGNWVDRGESAIPTITQSLAHYFERFDESDQPWLEEQATLVFGMVAGDATEVHIASYLRSVVRDVGFPTRQPLGTRLFAISIWHIAKVALVRDFAASVLRGDVPIAAQTPDTLGNWLAARLMTTEELAEFDARGNSRNNSAGDANATSAYAD